MLHPGRVWGGVQRRGDTFNLPQGVTLLLGQDQERGGPLHYDHSPWEVQGGVKFLLALFDDEQLDMEQDPFQDVDWASIVLSGLHSAKVDRLAHIAG